MTKVVALLCTAWMVLHPPSAQASHGRGYSVSYTLNSSALLTVECYSVWESSNVGAPTFQVRTAANGGGTLVGTMTSTSTTNPFATGSELDNRSFVTRKDVFTFSLSDQGSGTYFVRWNSGNRISGISNISNSSSASWRPGGIITRWWSWTPAARPRSRTC